MNHWCIRVEQLLATFDHLRINHIFREHNMLADGLSKKALKLEVGTRHFSETLDGKVIGDGHFSLFLWLFIYFLQHSVVMICILLFIV